MTWLVTGGAGYVGAHVVSQATNSGFNVVVLDDLSTGVSRRLESKIPLRKISLQDNDALNILFEDFAFEGVVHIAAKKRVDESIEKPEYYWQENVGGLNNLLNAIKTHNVKNFVFSSSAAVYGQPNVPYGTLITEETPCIPINPYGMTKREGEVLSRAMAECSEIKVVALRYFNVAGAGRPELGDQYAFNLVPIVFDAFEREVQPLVFGNEYSTPDGSCIRDYVHVQDLAESHIAAMNFVENSKPGFTAINIGTGEGASVFEVLSMIQEVTGKEISPIHAPPRDGDPASLIADVSKAKEVLNWSSGRDLREIVESAWEAWKFNKGGHS
jgi:UDP-glucose 4-epimerase